ncbi:hypothetical protein EJB05_15405 [Eragrostis curvula]|uniref:Uncharacterized protein n=1 Tax=Eragrostis curvula TaxID=38414 RepID=A0A5J9SP00_9POAL|nr:hypothetical protein EJB05_53811 [Eragrostis curvula]TVU41850.1 hypothetical protein EJB05_15405 [Eragrostis curvula]
MEWCSPSRLWSGGSAEDASAMAGSSKEMPGSDARQPDTRTGLERGRDQLHKAIAEKINLISLQQRL